MLCSVPKDGKALECIVKEFKKEKESCEMQLTSRRKESERLQENKEKKLLNSIGEIAAKSREFNKLVMQIDKVLKG